MPRDGAMSQQARGISEKFGVEVVLLKGNYARHPEKKRAIIIDGAEPCSVEEYACRHFRSLGYSTLIVANTPIYVLFGVYMSPLIQDATDPYNRKVGIGFKFDAARRGKLVWTLLPEDFGKRGYG